MLELKDKVIEALEVCMHGCGGPCAGDECPCFDDNICPRNTGCEEGAMYSAIKLIKEQAALIEELRTITRDIRQTYYSAGDTRDIVRD